MPYWCNVEDSKASSDSKLDEALEETFPASDPAANTVETGIRSGELPPSLEGSRTDTCAGIKERDTIPPHE